MVYPFHALNALCSAELCMNTRLDYQLDSQAYVKSTFCAGSKTTQLSESLNADIRHYLKSDLDLVQFFKHFEREVDNKRYNELKAEYNLRQKLPRKKMNTPMLTQAGEVYTSKVFEKFQAEYEVYQAAYIEDRINEGLPTSEYTVEILGQPKTYKV